MQVHAAGPVPGEKRGYQREPPGDRALARVIDSSVSAKREGGLHRSWNFRYLAAGTFVPRTPFTRLPMWVAAAKLTNDDILFLAAYRVSISP